MINTDEVYALAKWIQNWKNTYKENPSINECITWFEWKFEDKELSPGDKNEIETILRCNSEK